MGEIKKHAGGRPPKYTNEDELNDVIEEYFDYCDNRIQQVYSKKQDDVIEIINPAPYTMSGLAYWLHIDRDTLLRYSKKAKFYGTIKSARDRVANDVENRLMEGGNAAGAIFNLKNNFGWKDQTQVDGTQKFIVETRQAKRLPIPAGVIEHESNDNED